MIIVSLLAHHVSSCSPLVCIRSHSLSTSPTQLTLTQGATIVWPTILLIASQQHSYLLCSVRHNYILFNPLFFFHSVAPRSAILNPQTLTISEFNTVTFTCSVTAVPQATVTWFTDASGSQQQLLSSTAGVDITQTVSGNQVTSTLTLTPALRSSEGQYICTTNNVFGNATVSGNLSVLCKLKFAF